MEIDMRTLMALKKIDRNHPIEYWEICDDRNRMYNFRVHNSGKSSPVDQSHGTSALSFLYTMSNLDVKFEEFPLCLEQLLMGELR